MARDQSKRRGRRGIGEKNGGYFSPSAALRFLRVLCVENVYGVIKSL